MNTMPEPAIAEMSVAEAFLRSLKAHGIDTLFANAGTDFAPIIEALTRLAGSQAAATTSRRPRPGPTRGSSSWDSEQGRRRGMRRFFVPSV